MLRKAFLVSTLAVVMLRVGDAQTSNPQTPPARTAAPAATAPITKLPVRRVVLYKNGVGYFEHVGRVRGSQSVAIDLNTAQLNDVLTSLTATDLGDGRIADVSFNSGAPFMQRLHELTLPIGEKTTLAGLLDALRGARLSVHDGDRTIVGRLLSVDKRQRRDGTTGDEIALVTDSGEMRSIELTPTVSVRLAESESAGQVSAYLGLLASNRAQDRRRLTIATVGTSARDVVVSYISEVPIWKTTYRIVMNGNSSPSLQGWAIVDNTVGEDWEDVELSLVAGAPHSFVQPVSQPQYGRRPVVDIARSASPTPQLHQETLMPQAGGLVGRVIDAQGAVLPGVTVTAIEGSRRRTVVTTDGGGRFGFSELPAGTYRFEFSLAGFKQVAVDNVNLGADAGVMPDMTLPIGDIAETVTVTGVSPRVDTQTSRSRSGGIRLGGSAVAGPTGVVTGGVVGGVAGGLSAPPPPAAPRAEAPAFAQSIGDLFEYHVNGHVTIRRNQSALVPILRTPIELERVSLWNERLGGARPLRAVWLKNTSGVTLDGGSFTVIDTAAFAGEGLLDAIRPGERRLLSYASDSAVQVDQRGDAAQHVSRLAVARGIVVRHTEQTTRKVYTVRNSDTSARVVVIEHPRRTGWTLAAGAAPIETSVDAYRFALPVEAGASATLVVDERQPQESSYAISSLSDDQIAVFVRESHEDPRLAQALVPIRSKKSEIATLTHELEIRQDEADRIDDEQKRLRENMTVLKGSAGEQQLLKRYVGQLNAHEDRLADLRRETAELERKRAAAQTEMAALLEALSFDVGLLEADGNQR